MFSLVRAGTMNQKEQHKNIVVTYSPTAHAALYQITFCIIFALYLTKTYPFRFIICRRVLPKIRMST